MIRSARKYFAIVPRRTVRALRRGLLAAVWAELKRLNTFGLRGGGSNLSRSARAARVRAALARKYRDRSPCC
jgi:hypothetical protein